MKWLLITTLGQNVGDEFIRIGIQNLIREVDPYATFDLLNKENPDHYGPRAFDRAVLCGMPLFWSLPDNHCQDIWWWDRIFKSWITEDRRRFLAFGVGEVHVDEITDFTRYCAAIEEVISRSWRVTTRQPVMAHPQLIESICPSPYAITRGKRPYVRLCNLMPEGGHFPYNVAQQEYWKKNLPDFVCVLRENNFEFVAHTKLEFNYMRNLGIDQPHYCDTPEEYLELYGRSAAFFGNRLHGAAVCAPWASTWAVTYDSRLSMVERLGGRATKPVAVTIESLQEWIDRWGYWPEMAETLRAERQKLVSLLREFAS